MGKATVAAEVVNGGGTATPPAGCSARIARTPTSYGIHCIKTLFPLLIFSRLEQVRRFERCAPLRGWRGRSRNVCGARSGLLRRSATYTGRSICLLICTQLTVERGLPLSKAAVDPLTSDFGTVRAHIE